MSGWALEDASARPTLLMGKGRQAPVSIKMSNWVETKGGLGTRQLEMVPTGLPRARYACSDPGKNGVSVQLNQSSWSMLTVQMLTVQSYVISMTSYQTD